MIAPRSVAGAQNAVVRLASWNLPLPFRISASAGCPFNTSAENPRYDGSSQIGETKVSSVVFVGQSPLVEPKQVKNRCV